MSLLIILDKFYTVTLTPITINKENRRKQHNVLSNIICSKININITNLLSF